MNETAIPVDCGSGFPATALLNRLASLPGVQRVPNPKLPLFVVKNFLEPELCRALIARIDANRQPSAIGDGNGDASYRTSETCAFARDDAVVKELDARITEFSRLRAEHGEPLQGARYAVGQEFKQHTDYFEPFGDAYNRFARVGGQRTWTIMVYLNETDAGGATRFKVIDKMVRPETGKLLAWDNLRPDGLPNPATLHQAMKVRAGVKYVITKWFRERPWG